MHNFWQNKKVLVTGGAGFLGNYVVKELVSCGVDKKNISIPVFPESDLRKMEDCKRAVQDIGSGRHWV